MAQIAKQTLDKICLFTLNCSLFHGNRKVSAADLKAALGVVITPEDTKDVMSLGVKRVFDKTELQKLTAVKGAMLRACASVGTPFLGGFAIPDHKATELASELDKLVAKGLSLKVNLLSRYQNLLDDFAKAKPKWAQIIKSNAFDKSYVDGQIQFDWNAVRVAAADDDGLMSKGLESKVGGLLGNLLTDISKASHKLQDESLRGKDGVTRKAFRPLLAMADKLDGFKFIDTRVGSLADMIRHVLSVMPPDGRIEGADLRNLLGLSMILCSPDSALIIGQKVASADVKTVYDLEFGAAYKPATPQAVPVAPQLLESPSMDAAFTGMQPALIPMQQAQFIPVQYTPPAAANLFGF
jgi:hypothetical protein